MLSYLQCIASWISRHFRLFYYQHHKHLYRGGGWWGATKWQVTAELCIFQGEMAHKDGPIAIKLSQNVAKSMVYIINQSYGDFQQGGCLYKPTSGIQWTPRHTWTSDRPQKQASAKADLSTFGSGVLAIS